MGKGTPLVLMTVRAHSGKYWQKRWAKEVGMCHGGLDARLRGLALLHRRQNFCGHF